MRTLHGKRVEKAIAKAKKAVNESYALYGNYFGWVVGQNPNFPPVTRSLDTIDWGAEHPNPNFPFPGGGRAVLQLGVAVKDPYQQYGWNHTEHRLEVGVDPRDANAAVRLRLPELTAGMERLRAVWQDTLDRRVNQPALTALEGWKRIGRGLG